MSMVIISGSMLDGLKLCSRWFACEIRSEAFNISEAVILSSTAAIVLVFDAWVFCGVTRPGRRSAVSFNLAAMSNR